MPKSKAKSSKVKSGRDPIAENQSQILKGEINGEQRATDFVVSGHSTGSPHSEMNEISSKVAVDASEPPVNYKTGRFNDFGLDSRTFEAPKSVVPQGATNSSEEDSSSVKKVLWSALGIAGAGLLGYLGYEAYSRYKMRKAAVPVFPDVQKYKRGSSEVRH